MKSHKKLFELNGKVAIITGGAGFLGPKHGEAIASAGGIAILADIKEGLAKEKAKEISNKYHTKVMGVKVDVTDIESIKKLLRAVLSKFGRVDILINNAANDPKIKQSDTQKSRTRFEHFSLEIWNEDLAIGLTSAFLCSQIIGTEMAKTGTGVILNIASDLGVIAPDQRIYRKNNLPDSMQNVKPVSYSVVKTGLIGLTRYMATYWADKGVRVNSISPGGVYNKQSKEFVQKLTNLIPMKRMADIDEYKGAIIFLCSEASSYMTGANLIIDGGRTCW